MCDKEFQFLLEKIRRNKGVDFSLYRKGTLRRRLDSRLRTTGCADYLEYGSYLNRNPREYDRLIEAVTINVTEFFRNPETFRAIQQKVLPEIIKNALHPPTCPPELSWRRRKPGTPSAALVLRSENALLRSVALAKEDKPEHAKNTIRVWCAGTSYGEETYSVAILFLQFLRESIDNYDVKILGTDIDPDCIAKAKIGIYEPGHLKKVGKNILNRYFSREGNNYRVNNEVRQLTEFKPHNIISDKPFKSIDLFLCRNVAIYFTKPLQEFVYNLFVKCLKPGGFLVLGKVESLNGYAQGCFETIDNKERICRKI